MPQAIGFLSHMGVGSAVGVSLNSFASCITWAPAKRLKSHHMPKNRYTLGTFHNLQYVQTLPMGLYFPMIHIWFAEMHEL